MDAKILLIFSLKKGLFIGCPWKIPEKTSLLVLSLHLNEARKNGLIISFPISTLHQDSGKFLFPRTFSDSSMSTSAGTMPLKKKFFNFPRTIFFATHIIKLFIIHNGDQLPIMVFN